MSEFSDYDYGSAEAAYYPPEESAETPAFNPEAYDPPLPEADAQTELSDTVLQANAEGVQRKQEAAWKDLQAKGTLFGDITPKTEATELSQTEAQSTPLTSATPTIEESAFTHEAAGIAATDVKPLTPKVQGNFTEPKAEQMGVGGNPNQTLPSTTTPETGAPTSPSAPPQPTDPTVAPLKTEPSQPQTPSSPIQPTGPTGPGQMSTTQDGIAAKEKLPEPHFEEVGKVVVDGPQGPLKVIVGRDTNPETNPAPFGINTLRTALGQEKASNPLGGYGYELDGKWYKFKGHVASPSSAEGTVAEMAKDGRLWKQEPSAAVATRAIHNPNLSLNSLAQLNGTPNLNALALDGLNKANSIPSGTQMGAQDTSRLNTADLGIPDSALPQGTNISVAKTVAGGFELANNIYNAGSEKASSQHSVPAGMSALATHRPALEKAVAEGKLPKEFLSQYDLQTTIISAGSVASNISQIAQSNVATGAMRAAQNAGTPKAAPPTFSTKTAVIAKPMEQGAGGVHQAPQGAKSTYQGHGVTVDVGAVRVPDDSTSQPAKTVKALPPRVGQGVGQEVGKASSKSADAASPSAPIAPASPTTTNNKGAAVKSKDNDKGGPPSSGGGGGTPATQDAQNRTLPTGREVKSPAQNNPTNAVLTTNTANPVQGALSAIQKAPARFSDWMRTEAGKVVEGGHQAIEGGKLVLQDLGLMPRGPHDGGLATIPVEGGVTQGAFGGLKAPEIGVQNHQMGLGNLFGKGRNPQNPAAPSSSAQKPAAQDPTALEGVEELSLDDLDAVEAGGGASQRRQEQHNRDAESGLARARETSPAPTLGDAGRVIRQGLQEAVVNPVTEALFADIQPEIKFAKGLFDDAVQPLKDAVQHSIDGIVDDARGIDAHNTQREIDATNQRHGLDPNSPIDPNQLPAGDHFGGISNDPSNPMFNGMRIGGTPNRNPRANSVAAQNASKLPMQPHDNPTNATPSETGSALGGAGVRSYQLNNQSEIGSVPLSQAGAGDVVTPTVPYREGLVQRRPDPATLGDFLQTVGVTLPKGTPDVPLITAEGYTKDPAAVPPNVLQKIQEWPQGKPMYGYPELGIVSDKNYGHHQKGINVAGGNVVVLGIASGEDSQGNPVYMYAPHPNGGEGLPLINRSDYLKSAALGSTAQTPRTLPPAMQAFKAGTLLSNLGTSSAPVMGPPAPLNTQPLAMDPRAKTLGDNHHKVDGVIVSPQGVYTAAHEGNVPATAKIVGQTGDGALILERPDGRFQQLNNGALSNPSSKGPDLVEKTRNMIGRQPTAQTGGVTPLADKNHAKLKDGTLVETGAFGQLTFRQPNLLLQNFDVTKAEVNDKGQPVVTFDNGAQAVVHANGKVDFLAPEPTSANPNPRFSMPAINRGQLQHPQPHTENGFTLFGENSTEAIRNLKTIDGKPIADVEAGAKPSVTDPYARTLFGADDNLIETMARDNDTVLASGVSHREIGHTLLQMRDLAEQQNLQVNGEPFRFSINGTPYRLSRVQGGMRSSPIEIRLQNESTGIGIPFRPEYVNMMLSHGIYGGENSVDRTPPGPEDGIMSVIPAKDIQYLNRTGPYAGQGDGQGPNNNDPSGGNPPSNGGNGSSGGTGGNTGTGSSGGSGGGGATSSTTTSSPSGSTIIGGAGATNTSAIRTGNPFGYLVASKKN
jgi:hypothetical protein